MHAILQQKTLYSQLRHCDKITYIILCNNAGLYIHVTLENVPIPLALTSQIATGLAPPSLSHDMFHWSGRSMWHSKGCPLKSTVIETGIREWCKCMGKPEDHKGDWNLFTSPYNAHSMKLEVDLGNIVVLKSGCFMTCTLGWST